MTDNRTKRFVLSLLLIVGVAVSQAQNSLATLEYWFDANYASRQTFSPDSNFTKKEIDMSGLCNGIHTIAMRVGDTEGRWSGTLLRHFLKTAPSLMLTDNQLVKYEYWIDDYANMQSGTMSGDNIQFDINVSSLCKGVHTLNYQVQDNGGRKSASQFVYFLIPDLEIGADTIIAYEYWFNQGSRTKVELQPAGVVVSLNDVVIEVKDVVPNTLEGYCFNASEERVEVDDSVTFGMQVYSAGNHGSLALLDKFPMIVPVKLDMKVLSTIGGSLTVDAPTAGRMQGMKSETAVGDTLIYILSLENVTADFYDADGNQLDAEREVTKAGMSIYTLKATSACTYMLLYGASEVQTNLTATLLVQSTTGVGSVWADNIQKSIHYNMGGQTIGTRQRGIHIVRMSDGTVRKVVVK